MAAPGDWRNRIVVDPKILVGKPVVRGTRISVQFVIERLACGWTVEDVLRSYPHLTAADIRACLAYAHAAANPPMQAARP